MNARMAPLLRTALLGGLALSACVTTQQVDPERSPDPRDDLPELSSAEQTKLESERHGRLADARPLATVLDLSEADPIINVRVVLQTGSADDPRGKEGLAALSGKLMRQATEKLSAQELANALYPWAAELEVQADKDTLVFLGRVHKDHAAPWTEILLDVLLHPRLDAGDFARVKEEQLAQLKSTLRTGNDEALQREALEALLYDGARLAPAAFPSASQHPYAHTPTGTVAGLESIQLHDVRAFLKAALVRDRVVLGISGGAPPEMVTRLRSALEALPFASAERAAVTAPAGPDRNVLLIVDKPSAGTAISVGFALPELNPTHPDYAAMKLAETWFGEHRNLLGHLFDSMREKRGLNYGSYAYVEHFVQEGSGTYERLNVPRRTQYFSMWIRPVEHKNRLFALRQAVWELDRLVKAGIPSDESFLRVQSFVQGYWRQKEAQPLRALGYRLDRKLTQAPVDRDGLRERVARLTRAEVNDAIQRHLRADRLALVVVTENGAALASDLVARKSSPLQYLAPNIDKGQLAEDAQIDAFDLGLSADRILWVKPDTLFAK